MTTAHDQALMRPASFALRDAPRLGESLDSYVHWVAREMYASPQAVVEHLRLGTPTSAGYLNRDVTDAALTEAANYLGVPVAGMHQTSLRRWEWLDLRPPRGKRGAPVGAWQRGSGARYCPRCLLDSDGRWKLAWYLQWSFACVEHATLLASVCSACGRAPRTHRVGTRVLHRHNALDLNCGCGGRARGEPRMGDTGRLDLADPRLRTQRRIDSLLAMTPTAQQVLRTADQPVSPLEWLTDLTLVTHLVMLSLRADGNGDAFTACAKRYDVDELARPTAWRERLPRSSVMRRPDPTPQVVQRELVKSAADIASCVTLADAILSSDDVDHLTTGLLWVRPEWRTQVQQRAARGQFACSDILMDAMTGRLRQTSSNWLRSVHAKHRRNERFASDAARFSPAALHPGFQGRLITIRGDVREAAIIAGLLARSTRPAPVKDTAYALGLAPLGSDIAEAWAQLSHNSAARPEIRAVAAWLFDREYQSSPVDFQHRRSLWPHPEPVPTDVMQELAWNLQTRNSPVLGQFASMYVWERLTGSDALLTPPALQAYGAFRVRYRHVRTRWHQCLPTPLYDHLDSLTQGALDTGMPTAETNGRPARSTPRRAADRPAHPHVLRTPLQPDPQLGADDLLGADAARIAQAVAARSNSAGWERLRMMWELGVDIEAAYDSPLVQKALTELSALSGITRAEDRDGPLLELMSQLMTILRTGEVPHDCPYERSIK